VKKYLKRIYNNLFDMHTSLVKYKLLAIRLATLVAMLLLVPHIQSQTVYPLRTFATINGTTPYTLDGFVSQDGKLQVQIITDDVTIEHYAVKLRLTLQSSSVRIVTSAAYRPQPIYLEGGTQEILTSIDLADLFNPNNLTFEGITKAQYNSTGRLPEGVYRISVDVLDYYRNVVVSRSTPAIGMMYLTKAPLLTFPANGAEIDIASSPQIRFSWMTYHPINPAAEVVHRFRLWEVKPAGRNPYEVINVLKPIYEEEVTTGAALLLSPDLPLLNQGSTYVWQIQGVDLQNQVIYQNSGKSEAYTFRYGKSCVMPVPRIVSIKTSGAQIAWNGNITTQQYRVNWKQTEDAEWHTDVTTLTTYDLKELIDNTDYQITVQAICGSEESETSAPIKFRTNRNVNYACGTGNGQFDISNTEPLPTLSRFDEFKAADFIIEANEVTGSNGSFSGTGYALVPYLSFLKMMVTFDNITINTDRRMIKGQIEFVYDETTGMVLSLFKSDPKKQAEVASEFLAKGVTQVVTTTKEVSSVSVNDKTVTISLADGSTQQVTVDKKGDTVGVISPDGKTAYVADTGSGMVFTTPVPGTGEAANSSSVATPSQTGKYGCSVVVSPAKTQRYGFDAVGNGKIKPNNYFLSSKSGDAVAWKSIPAGGTDFVDVTVTGNCSPDSLRFLRENDMPVPSAPSGTARQLLLTGTAEGDEEVLTIALSSKQLQKDSTYRQTLTEAGALGLVTYTPIVKDVIMVPVNKATAPTGSGAIKTTLDKLFAPALVSWNVTIASAITVPDITEESFKTTGLSMASRYTSDMNKVIKAYKETHKIAKNTLVLFFVTSPNSDKMGYMPLTGDYGFIFNLSSNVELLAHELSHGAFNLRHTFSDDAYWRGNGKAPVFPEKTTQNLMDYANGTELWKYQWDLIHDPEGILFGALDEEEGAKINFVEIDEPKGIDCKGRIIGDFHATDNNKFLVPCLSKTTPYVIVGFNIYDKATKAKEKYVPCDDFESNLISVNISKGSGKVPVFLLTNDNCTYQKLEIDWTYKEGIDLTTEISKRAEGGNWKVRAFLYNADISCFIDFIKIHDASQECLNVDNINKDFESLSTFFGGKGNDEKLVYLINSLCKSALKKCSYDQLSELFERLGNSEEIKNDKEIAILRLMSCINSSDYSKFYKLLESSNNKLIINLISKISDSSFPWGDDNYTSFTGGLIQMFKVNPEGYMDRIGADGSEQLAGQVINLNSKPFVSDIEVSIFGGLIPLNEFRYTGVYDNETGKIKIYKEEKVLVSTPLTNTNGGNNATSEVSFPTWGISGEALAELSPLTPVVISATDNLPLVETALGEPVVDSNEDIYIVPAIFFKYKGDKEFNHAVGQTAMITLDAITIYASGGTLLATKIFWVKRIWALTEVAGAIGNIVINSGGEVSPKFQTTMDIYNGTMGVIGLYHAGNGVYKLAKTIPEATRKLLAENKNIRAIIMANYLKWQIAVKNIGNLTDDERQIVSKQEQVWEILGAGKMAKGGDDLSNLFASARQSAIAKFGKEAEDLIYIKFNKDGGAAAEILDHYGIDGLNALKKSSTIDEAAKEIVKDKTLYRAVNESTYNFEKLKNQGIIDASPSQYPTYVSLDHYTDANVIQSKLQLPKKPTWVAEFDGNQIINDVKIPNGKYLTAEYKEVLCRSYPEINGVKLEGGGSQFITNSEIKAKRLINLETGEIINFTH
jgi:hypothetical protein